MAQEKRIINEPNLKIEVTKQTGKYTKSEATVSYSGNINEFDPKRWVEVVSQVREAVLLTIKDIIKKLDQGEE